MLSFEDPVFMQVSPEEPALMLVSPLFGPGLDSSFNACALPMEKDPAKAKADFSANLKITASCLFFFFLASDYFLAFFPQFIDTLKKDNSLNLVQCF